MSWQAYVDDLINSKKFVQAAILDIDGSSWAVQPKDFFVPLQETKPLIRGFQRTPDLYAKGLEIGGAQYPVVEATDVLIHCQKDSRGVICIKTKRAVLLGVYEAPIVAEEGKVVLQKLANYLESVGY